MQMHFKPPNSSSKTNGSLDFWKASTINKNEFVRRHVENENSIEFQLIRISF